MAKQVSGAISRHRPRLGPKPGTTYFALQRRGGVGKNPKKRKKNKRNQGTLNIDDDTKKAVVVDVQEDDVPSTLTTGSMLSATTSPTILLWQRGVVLATVGLIFTVTFLHGLIRWLHS